MKNKISAFLRLHTHSGDHIVVAVSGGKDSMALLHAIWNLREEHSITVSAAHFNHNLRGAESQRDEDFVRNWCTSMEIPLDIGRCDVRKYAVEQGLSTETAAREKRYAFLLSLPGKIVTAHTAQDNLETVLMHLLRGSGLHGLTGILPERGNLLRPMLDVTRSEVELYLLSNNIPYIEDSSNQEDIYLRNRIRHHILPLFEKENGSTAESVFHLCQTLRAEDDFMEEQAQTAMKHLLHEGRLDIKGVLALPYALQNRVISRFMHDVPQIQRVHIEGALRLCQSASPSASMSLPARWTLQRIYTQLVLVPPAQPLAPPVSMTIAAEQTVMFGPWCVTCRRAKLKRTSNILAIDEQKINGIMMLRTRRNGDRIAISGGSKKVSRFLIDEKIPAVWRDTIPILCCENSILAVLPLRVSYNFQAKPGQDSLLLSAKRMEEKNESGCRTDFIHGGRNQTARP